VDWALPKDKYLEAIGSRQIGNHYDETMVEEQDSEEKGIGQEDDDDFDDEMEQDEDEGDDKSQDEEEQEVDDGINNGDENGSDNDSSVIENRIHEDEEDDDDDEDEEEASEDGSDVIEIHDEVPKNPSEGTVLFIRNLSFDATEEELSNM
jgi:nucleolar protein 4